MKWDLMTSAFPRNNKRTTAFYTSPRHFWVSMWLVLTLQDFVHQMGSTQNYYSKWRIYYRCAQISSVNTKWKSEVYCIHTLNAYYSVFVVHFPSTDFLWISHLIILGFIWTFGLNNRRLTGTICTRCALSRLCFHCEETGIAGSGVYYKPITPAWSESVSRQTATTGSNVCSWCVGRIQMCPFCGDSWPHSGDDCVIWCCLLHNRKERRETGEKGERENERGKTKRGRESSKEKGRKDEEREEWFWHPSIY